MSYAEHLAYYEKCCAQRERDLMLWVAKVFPGQTITADYVFKNATLHNIAKGSQATQRVINWCRTELAKKGVAA